MLTSFAAPIVSLLCLGTRTAPLGVRLCIPDALDRAQRLLEQYDADHRAAAAIPGARGLGGALTANEWSQTADLAALSDAVRALRTAAKTADGRVMLGICADDATSGVAMLKAWVTALDLPRGVLHGMDRDGVPIDMSTFGSVYIKYNSHPTSQDAAGSAALSGYEGDFRGVYYNPDLGDGVFRQYAVLPGDLFTVEGGAPAATAVDPDAAAAKACAKAARLALSDLLPALAELGAVAVIEGATADGVVRLRYTGPPKLLRSVQMAVQKVASVQRIEVVGLAREAEDAAGLVSAAAGGGRSRVVQVATESVTKAAATTDGTAASPSVPSRYASVTGRFASRAAPAESTKDESPFEKLHRQGWVILPAPHPLDTIAIAAIRSSSFAPIFNGQPAGEPSLRLMGRSRTWTRVVEEIFADILSDADLLQCSSDGLLKTVNDCFCLRSLPLPGVREADVAAVSGRQPAHSDSPEPPSGSLAEIEDRDFPLSAMLAVQEDTCLWVYPEGCGSPAELIHFDIGEVMVWRGDLVHAGAGYVEDHVRVHAYVDPPPTVYQREFGKTNRCLVDVSSSTSPA